MWNFVDCCCGHYYTSVTRGLVGFLDKPSGHNCTARDADDLSCLKHEISDEWDECRGMHVIKVECLIEHKSLVR